MTDRVDGPTRHRIMAAVKSRDTGPELLVRKRLHAAGFRFRVNVRGLPGKPDIVLPQYHLVVFVHGCFWHGHRCKHFRLPASNVEYWTRKIVANRQRDLLVSQALQEAGWTVMIIWACEVEDKTQQLIKWLRAKRLARDEARKR